MDGFNQRNVRKGWCFEMLTIDRRWDCWEIAHNDRYIASMGNGVTVWNRATLEPVHHFTGVRWIHGGILVDDDVLMVYTGEQKIFFFQISQKKRLWAVTRPRELDVSGDMCCCPIPGTEKVACVAQGKKSLEEHFLLVVDWKTQEQRIQRIPDCYRVVSNFVRTQELGLAFLSWQAKGDNVTMLYRIFRVDNAGSCSILYNGESALSVLAYSGHYLFMADYSGQTPEASAYPLEGAAEGDTLHLGKPLPLRIPPLLTDGPVGTKRLVLPKICWIDENAGLLVACHSQKWLGIYNFLDEKMIAEQQNSKVLYGKLLDGRLLLGCAPGFLTEEVVEN